MRAPAKVTCECGWSGYRELCPLDAGGHFKPMLNGDEKPCPRCGAKVTARAVRSSEK